MSFLPFLVLQVLIFAALVVVLRRILRRHLTTATAHLQGLSAEYTRRHEELKQRLQEAERQYGEQMTRAKVEAEQLIAQARQEAEASRARLLEEARTESERIVQQAIESRDALRKEIEQAMESRAIEWACELIQQTLPGQLRREVQSRWLEDLIQHGLAQVNGLETTEDIQAARVVSAFPLTPSQRSALLSRLKERLGHEVAVTEETDERLVVGMIITLGSVVLDGSLASKVRQAARQAQSSS